MRPTPLQAAPWYSPATIAGSSTIYGAAQGGTGVVVIGGAGLIATATNGRDWTRRSSGTIQNLFGVAYGSGRFVAVGASGTIVSSADGVTWTAEKHPFSAGPAPDINGITYGNGRFVAVSRSLGSAETVITSTDGRTWTLRTVDRPGYQLQFVVFANGQYVAGGGGIVMVSSDATTWRTVWTGSKWLYAGVRGATRWIVFGSDGIVLTSTDGATWAESSLGQRPTIYAAAYRNGRFLAVGQNGYTIPGNNASVFSSTDGVAWTEQPFAETAPVTRLDFLYALLPTDTGLLAFGGGGLIAETNDGTAWNVLSQPARRPHLLDLVYANGLFVAVGDESTNRTVPGLNQGRTGAIYTSTDGWNWQPQVSGVEGMILTKVAFGAGRFVAAGTGGVIVSSSDGVTWQRAVHPVTLSWQGLAYGAGRFVAAGSGGTMISTDGVTWQTQPATASNSYSGVCFANGSFFLSVSPFTGPVQCSTDGVNWTTVTTAISCAFREVAFSDGLWVAATTGAGTTFEGSTLVSVGGLQTSTDGSTWTAVRVTPYLGAFQSVQRLKDRWIAGTMEGAIFSSTDGRNWTLEDRPTNNGIARFASAADYTVAVGNFAMVLTTRDPATLPPAVRPSITVAPMAQTVVAGSPLALSVAVSGTPAPSFQWLKDGVALFGAIGATYNVARTGEGDSGNYSVIVTNAAGSVTSPAVAVTVLASRLVNLSIRSVIGPASPELIVGFFASGANKPLLVRAVGPALTQFGVSPTLAHPSLSLYSGQTPIATNDGWDRAANAAQIAAATSRVGAFTLPASSADAAALNGFGTGTYTAVVRSQSDATAGVVLVEIYDADTTVGRLTNVSALGPVGSGDAFLTAGFVVSGNATKRLLVRAIGPGLTAYGRTAVLADPQLSVIRAGSTTALAANDNWGGGDTLRASFVSVGAFALANGSKDAALVVSLDSGAYTAQVSGVAGATGDALVEIYELPE